MKVFDLVPIAIRVSAIFDPKRVDDLRPEAVPFIGRRFEWLASWTFEDDNPRYGGQTTFVCDDPEWEALGLVWAPAEDLRDPGADSRGHERPRRQRARRCAQPGSATPWVSRVKRPREREAATKLHWAPFGGLERERMMATVKDLNDKLDKGETEEEAAARRARNREKRRRQTLRGPDYRRALRRAEKAEAELRKVTEKLAEVTAAGARLLAQNKDLRAELKAKSA